MVGKVSCGRRKIFHTLPSYLKKLACYSESGLECFTLTYNFYVEAFILLLFCWYGGSSDFHPHLESSTAAEQVYHLN